MFMRKKGKALTALLLTVFLLAGLTATVGAVDDFTPTSEDWATTEDPAVQVPGESTEDESIKSELSGPDNSENKDALLPETILETPAPENMVQQANEIFSDGSDGPQMSPTTVEVTSTNHYIEWINNVTGAGNASFDGNKLTIVPNVPKSITYTKIGTIKIPFAVNFSAATKDGILLNPGCYEIRMPCFLYQDEYYGLEISLPKDAPGGSTNFQYTIDEKANEIVITNNVALSDPALVFEAAYIIHADAQMRLPEGKVWDIYANFIIRDNEENVIEEYSTPALELHCEHTAPSFMSLTKEQGTNNTTSLRSNWYNEWQTEWGNTYRPVNHDEYLYIDWCVTPKYASTQPVFAHIIETPGANPEALFIGRTDLQKESIFSPRRSLVSAQLDDIIWPSQDFYYYTDTQTIRFVYAYPKEAFGVGETTVSNTIEIQLEGTLNNKLSTSRTRTAITTVTKLGGYTGDSFDFIKRVARISPTGADNAESGINLLESDRPVSVAYGIQYTSNQHAATDGGIEAQTHVIVDDNVTFGGAELIAGVDYEFASIKFNYSEYSYLFDERTGEKYTSLASEKHGTAELYITADGSKWEHFTSMKKVGGNIVYVNPVNNEPYVLNSYGAIDLPRNTQAVKLVGKTAADKVEYILEPLIKLNPTETVKDYIAKNHRVLTNTARVLESPFSELTGQERSHDVWITRISARTYSPDSYGRTAITHFHDEGYARIHGQMQVHDFASSITNKFSVEDLLKDGILSEQRDATFYVLLPAGVTIDTSSIKVRKDISSENAGHWVEQFPNWEDSGRTMVAIHVSIPDDETNYKVSNGRFESGYIVTYACFYSYENIPLYGTELEFSSAYRPVSTPLAQGQSASKILSTPGTAQYFVDLNRDGIPDEEQTNLRYIYRTATVEPLHASQTGTHKFVRAEDELNYSTAATVSASGLYTYLLRFSPVEDSRVTGLVLYDILENHMDGQGTASAWRGVLQSVDTSHPEMLGIQPVVYYSTQAGLDPKNGIGKDITDTSIWSTTLPADTADVQAIAVDLSRKANGDPYIFENKQAVGVYIHMAAPRDWAAHLENMEAAANVAAVQQVFLDAAGNPTGELLETSNAATVTLRQPDVALAKSASPAGGTGAAPVVVRADDEIVYTLTLRNTSANEQLLNTTFVDIIPTGLTVKLADVQYYYGDDEAGAASVQGASGLSVTQDGQTLTFRVDRLALDGVLNFVVPARVTGRGGTLLANTASVQQFNGRSFVLNSETTYHKIKEIFAPGITKTASKDELLVGDEFSYTLVVSNPNPDEALLAVNVVDTLPNGIGYLRDSSGGAYNASGREITWTLDLPADGSAEIRIDAKALTAGTWTNVATASKAGTVGGGNGGNGDGNTAGATVEVTAPAASSSSSSSSKTEPGGSSSSEASSSPGGTTSSSSQPSTGGESSAPSSSSSSTPRSSSVLVVPSSSSSTTSRSSSAGGASSSSSSPSGSTPPATTSQATSQGGGSDSTPEPPVSSGAESVAERETEPNVRLFGATLPLGGLTNSSGWSLFNLLLSVLALFSAVILFVRLLAGRRQNADEEVAVEQPENLDDTSEAETTKRPRRTLWMWLALLSGLLPLLLFLLLENLTNMVMFTRWTPLIVAAFLAHTILLLFSHARRHTSEEEDAPEDVA